LRRNNYIIAKQALQWTPLGHKRWSRRQRKIFRKRYVDSRFQMQLEKDT